MSDTYSNLTRSSDVAIAKALKAEFDSSLGGVVHAEGEFWHYGDTCWQRMDRDELRQAVHRYDGRKPDKGRAINLSAGKIDSILRELAGLCRQHDFFAKAPTGINCANGFITFDSAGNPTIQPHARGHRQRHTLAGHWHVGTVAEPGPKLAKLLSGSFLGDADASDKVKLIAEVCGAAALGIGTRLPNKKAIVLYGPSARNGKSQILDMVRGLLPPDAITCVPPAQMANPHSAIKLVGKLLNASDELSAHIASAAFKAVVDGNMVTARNLYQPEVDFCPVALNLFATNVLPRFSGGPDRGVRDRLLVLRFNRTIPPEERIADIGQRIAIEEADALLAFAVEGATRLLRQGGYTVPASSPAALTDFMTTDSVADFIEERLTVDGTSTLRTRDLYDHYCKFADHEGYSAKEIAGLNTFTKRLVTMAPDQVRYRRTAEGRYFDGWATAGASTSKRPSWLQGVVSGGLE